MRSAVKNVIFTFSLVASIAAQAISVGKVDFEKKSVTGVEVELASSMSNDVSVCGAKVGGFLCFASEMIGVQVGLGSQCENEVNGIQIGGLGSQCENEVNGIQIGGLGSMCWNKMNGIQIGGFSSLCTNEVNGIQIGGICCGAGKMRGVQIAGLISAGDKMSGLQIGAINYFIKDVSGVQIGVFNYAGEKSDNCLQIGVVNWLSANETMKIVPFVNFRF